MGDVSLDQQVKAEPDTGGIAQGNQVTDFMSAGWTDERHTLYISSMEASFIDQLYNHGRNLNQNDSSGNAFKILRGVVWEKKLKFEKTNASARIGGKYRLPANPWIRHVRPRDFCSNARGDEAEASVGDHESGIQTIRGRTPLSHGRELRACEGENLLDEKTEVSDQNFSDDEVEVDAESSKACKKKEIEQYFHLLHPHDQVKSQD